MREYSYSTPPVTREAFKYCESFTKCITKIDGEAINDA